MGWTIQECKRTGFAPRTFFIDLLGKEHVVDAAVKSGTLYAAVRHEKDPSIVRGVVCITDWSVGPGKFAYKIIDECEGPYYFDCPKRVIDLLTPLSTEFDGELGAENALRWRSRCLSGRKSEARAKEVLSDPRSFPLKMREPLMLTNGFSVREVTAVLSRKRGAWVWRASNGMVFSATPSRIFHAAFDDDAENNE